MSDRDERGDSRDGRGGRSEKAVAEKACDRQRTLVGKDGSRRRPGSTMERNPDWHIPKAAPRCDTLIATPAALWCFAPAGWTASKKQKRTSSWGVRGSARRTDASKRNPAWLSRCGGCKWGCLEREWEHVASERSSCNLRCHALASRGVSSENAQGNSFPALRLDAISVPIADLDVATHTAWPHK